MHIVWGRWGGTRQRGGVDTATTETERKVECEVRAHAVVGDGSAVFQLLA